MLHAVYTGDEYRIYDGSITCGEKKSKFETSKIIYSNINRKQTRQHEVTNEKDERSKGKMGEMV